MIKRGKLKLKNGISFKGSVSFAHKHKEKMTEAEKKALIEDLYSWPKEAKK